MSNFYPSDVIEEVRVNNDIVEVVSEYIRLERKGKDFFGLCPFHKEKTPSFSVVPAKQIYYCFGCGKGGNVIHFIMNAEKLDFIEAIRLLADRINIVLPESNEKDYARISRLKQGILNVNKEAARYFFNTLKSGNGEEARRYLRLRNLKTEVIRKFGIGYSSTEWDQLYKYLLSKEIKAEYIIESGLVVSNKKGGYYDRFRGRIMFPIFDIRGNIIAFGGRVIDSSMPKYMNSPETIVFNKRDNLYSLNFAKNSEQKSLIIVEGYMDVISLHQSGIINTVASLGTALTEKQGRLLKKYAQEVVISFDSDSSGQAAAMRGLDLLNSIGCNVRILMIPEGKDPDEYIRKNGAEKFKRLLDNSIKLVEYKIKSLKSRINTDGIEGKIDFLNKMAVVLSKLDNNVEREMYIKKLAGEYEISEESLFSEVYKRIRKPANYKKDITWGNKMDINRKTNEINGTRIIHDERFILSLLCTDNNVYRMVKDEIKLENFTDYGNRKAAEIVIERLNNRKGIEPGELLNIVDNQVSDEYARIINEECHCDDNKKAIMGKIRSIELYKLEERQKGILELLKNQEGLKEGDVERLKGEFREIADLIMKKKNY